MSEDAKKNFHYKNVDLLKRYITETGKIIPARVSNVTASEQRKLTKAVKIARFLALLPYTDSHR
jgi:small subunit ribosomal protein S18